MWLTVARKSHLKAVFKKGVQRVECTIADVEIVSKAIIVGEAIEN